MTRRTRGKSLAQIVKELNVYLCWRRRKGSPAAPLTLLPLICPSARNKDPTTETERYLEGAQSQMLVRILIGVVNEAWNLVSTRFVRNQIGQQYTQLLDAGGQTSLSRLKRQFGSSNLLPKIRNTYSFHHPDSDIVEAAFDSAFNDPAFDGDWNYYFSQHGFNTSFFLADLVIAHGIFIETKESDFNASQYKLMREVTGAANDLQEFAKSYTKVIWLKYFGPEILCDKVFDFEAPSIDSVSIPFLVELVEMPELGAEIGI